MTESPKRILIIGPAWVGDMVMAQSLFITLKQQHPDCLIDVVAPEWSKPLLQRMPQVSNAITQPLGHGEFGLGARYQLGKQLREQHYDMAITLPRSLKSALVPWFAKIALRIGYRGEMRFGLINDIRALDKNVLTQTVQRFVALGVERNAKLPPEIPQPQLGIDQVNQKRCLNKLGLQLDKPVIGFMPGAEYGPAKRWPADYFAGLADYLVSHGYQVWLLGSERDKPVAEEIRQAAQAANQSSVKNLCGETALQDVIDLLALMPVVVTNDSGLMHVAAAVGCKVVAIYGSSTPDYTPPLTDKAHVLYERLSCSPCFERECPLGHTQCLTLITTDKVIRAVQDMIASQ